MMKLTRAEHIARMVMCRANDVDPYVPDKTIEKLFDSYDGERAVDEVRSALKTERLYGIVIGGVLVSIVFICIVLLIGF